MKKEEERIKEIRDIVYSAPELNMANYDENQVEQINNALIEIFNIVNEPPPPQSAEEFTINKLREQNVLYVGVNYLTSKDWYVLMEEYANQQKVLSNDEIERINNYGRHQFNRGGMRLDLISYEKWKQVEKPKNRHNG